MGNDLPSSSEAPPYNWADDPESGVSAQLEGLESEPAIPVTTEGPSSVEAPAGEPEEAIAKSEQTPTAEADQVEVHVGSTYYTREDGTNQEREAGEPKSRAIDRIKEELASLTEGLSGLERDLQAAKERAKAAIDAEDFKEAALSAAEAAQYRPQMESKQEKVAYQQSWLKFAQEALDPANILDLKTKIDARISKEKDIRQRAYNMEPVDTEEIKKNFINEYMQTGLKKGEPRRNHPDLTEDISDLVARSYEDLQDMLRARGVKSNISPPPAGTPPSPAPERRREHDRRVLEEEKKFAENEAVHAVYNGELQPNWTVNRFSRTSEGNIEVQVVSPDREHDFWVLQDQLEGWQSMHLPTDISTSAVSLEQSTPDVASPTSAPEPRPTLAESPPPSGADDGPEFPPARDFEWGDNHQPEDGPATGGGFWDNLFPERAKKMVEASRGGRGKIFGGLGRIGRKGAQEDKEKS